MGVEEPHESRKARRAFIRSHHPDVGGDPVLFAEGLKRLDDRPPAATRVVPSAATANFRARRSTRPDRVLLRWLRRARAERAGRPPRNLQ